MMKKLAIVIATLTMFFSTQVQARHYRYHHRYAHQYYHHYGNYLTTRHYRRVHRHYSHHLRRRGRTHVAVYGGRETLPGPCQTAARMGGPCGCWTEYNTRGFLDHVREGINWWLAADWLGFRSSIPVLGTAAAYRNRSHVVPVLRANGDGTVTVRDYWGIHKVSLAMVKIVDPHPYIRAGWRVAEAWPL